MKLNSLKLFVILAGMTLHIVHLPGQTIRKNYREMTSAEKQIFVNALSELRPSAASNTVVALYATNHQQLFSTSIHQNRTTNNNNDFLCWHRWFILYFEKELRNTSITGANKISLPYWDWTSNYYLSSPTDQVPGAPLWSSDFLGPFNTSWSLNRNLGGSSFGNLATHDEMEQVMANASFVNFQALTELNLHNGPHVWVGGEMADQDSPKDPVFYLHHNMVDKIWQDWHNLGRSTTYSEENMPNTVPSGATNFPTGTPVTVPSDTDPSSIIDSRSPLVKVWYAENGKVILDRYTVSNTENYYYTGVIEAGSRVITSVIIDDNTENFLTGDFIIPSGTTCNFISGGLQMGTAPEAGYIKLVPGFRAETGSVFTAKINTEYFTDASSSGRTAYFEGDSRQENLRQKFLNAFPNPVNETLFIEVLTGQKNVMSYSIANAFGFTVKTGNLSEGLTRLDVSDLSPGVYVLSIVTVSEKKFIQRVMVE